MRNTFEAEKQGGIFADGCGGGAIHAEFVELGYVPAASSGRLRRIVYT